MAHGFSKALLFLGAGSVMHGADQTDIRKMGGLAKVMPLTSLTFAVGALSLAGIPIFAGFWSKDEILLAVLEHRHWLFLAFTLLAVFLSALYMARAYFIAFRGPLKAENRNAHEAPTSMALPMVLLAALAAGFGFIALEWGGGFEGIGSFLFFDKAHGFEFNVVLAAGSLVLALGAVYLAWASYLKGKPYLSTLKAMTTPFPALAERGYFFDDVYQWTIDRVVLVFANFIGFFDRAIVNDVGINGPADAVRRLGITLRLHVTGHLYSYALAMVLGAVGLAIFWWLITS
jgi:NADH-quinone oxidoreductase subunit L